MGMSPYYAGGLGIPYPMGMGGLGTSSPDSRTLHLCLLSFAIASPCSAGRSRVVASLMGAGYGMGMYGLGMGMGYPYGMMAGNPYAYTGMVRTPYTSETIGLTG
jgi:hypothetical protein